MTSHATEFESLPEQLRRDFDFMRGLESGWFGEGSLPPHNSTIELAIAVLCALNAYEDVCLPHFTEIAENGREIGAPWDLLAMNVIFSRDEDGAEGIMLVWHEHPNQPWKGYTKRKTLHKDDVSAAADVIRTLYREQLGRYLRTSAMRR